MLKPPGAEIEAAADRLTALVIATDNRELIEAVTELIRALNAEVSGATDGVEASLKLRTAEPLGGGEN